MCAIGYCRTASYYFYDYFPLPCRFLYLSFIICLNLSVWICALFMFSSSFFPYIRFVVFVVFLSRFATSSYSVLLCNSLHVCMHACAHDRTCVGVILPAYTFLFAHCSLFTFISMFVVPQMNLLFLFFLFKTKMVWRLAFDEKEKWKTLSLW